MLDQSTPEGRIVTAALGLAAVRPWREISLLDIAAAASTDLVDLRRHFGSKSAILAAFSRAVDDVVLRQARRPAEGQSPRDALFEVVMSRLDALAPYKAAVRSIAADTSLDPAAIGGLLSSQAWMLNAAGIGTDGLEGGVKVAGLAGVYASVLRTWLDDDDPGMARTMAALDRRLRRGERSLEALGEAMGFVRRMAGLVIPGVAAGARPAGATADEAGASSTAAPR